MSSPAPKVDALRRAVAGGPDPDGGALGVARLVDAMGGEVALDVALEAPSAVVLAATLLSQSEWLGMLLARDPAALAALAVDPWLSRPKPRERHLTETAAATAKAATVEALDRELRRHRDREMLRLGARELGFGRPEEVWRELCHLADACMEVAVGFHGRALAREAGEPRVDPAALAAAGEADRALAPGGRTGLAIVAMGKLGGEELNFCSDIDLLYLYLADEGSAGRLTLHEHFSRVAERTTRTLEQVTDEGFVFRVDLRLRPEGTRGPLTNSLAALERYYETWGRPWERQAWVKARAAAGDLGVGERACELLAPFVYRRTLSSDSVGDVVGGVRALLAKTRAELARRVDPALDVKLGPGGIREVEFFVQALQLLHGGRQPALRARSTLQALAALQAAGLVSHRERRVLESAYRFLRIVEHRLQLGRGRQTHRLPEDEEARGLLARRLGFADTGTFEERLDTERRAVQEVFATLGGGRSRAPSLLPDRRAVVESLVEQSSDEPPLTTRYPREGPWLPAELSLEEAAVETLCDLRSGEEEIGAALGVLGFADPPASAEEIERLRTRPGSPLAAPPASGAGRVARRLLGDVAESADPDMALRHVVDIASRRPSAQWVWRLCAESRAASRLLAGALGTSESLGRLLVARPDLLADVVVPGGTPVLGRGEVEAEARRRIDAVPAGESDPDRALAALVRLRDEQQVRVGLLDVAGLIGVDEVGVALADLAEGLLPVVLDDVAARVTAQLGRPVHEDGTPAYLALLAMGSLGARDLGYASDLDLVVVYSGEGRCDGTPGGREVTCAEYFARVAQRLVGALTMPTHAGRLYDVDLRLRPSGSQGTLVVSLAAFRAYHEMRAQVWERQALLRARPVAGDPALAATLAALIEELTFLRPAGDPSAVAAGLAAMRERQIRELASRGAGAIDVKYGAGGLLDVDFAAQLLQIVHASTLPALRVRGTVAALDAAAAGGLIAPGEHRALTEGRFLLRRIEQRLRLAQGRSATVVETDPAALAALARRLGHGGTASAAGGAALLADLRARMDAVRAAFVAIVARDASAP